MNLQTIFDFDVEEYRRDIEEGDGVFSYGGPVEDLLVLSWEQFHDPVLEFKEAGYYSEMKKLV